MADVTYVDQALVKIYPQKNNTFKTQCSIVPQRIRKRFKIYLYNTYKLCLKPGKILPMMIDVVEENVSLLIGWILCIEIEINLIF